MQIGLIVFAALSFLAAGILVTYRCLKGRAAPQPLHKDKENTTVSKDVNKETSSTAQKEKESISVLNETVILPINGEVKLLSFGKVRHEHQLLEWPTRPGCTKGIENRYQK